MTIERNLTDDELDILKEAGAEQDFITFVDVFPQSTAGQNVLHWFEAEDIPNEELRKQQWTTGGAFFDYLWSGDLEMAFRNADKTNEQHMRTLFGDSVRSQINSVA